MTTDRELLELAAKAAGIDASSGFYDDEDGLHVFYKPKPLVGDDRWYWNPLTDDGDALRLAVKLRFTLITLSDSIEVNSYDNTQCGQEMTVDGADPYAATRRAIVRAAAEIGKGK